MIESSLKLFKHVEIKCSLYCFSVYHYLKFVSCNIRLIKAYAHIYGIANNTAINILQGQRIMSQNDT